MCEEELTEERLGSVMAEANKHLPVDHCLNESHRHTKTACEEGCKDHTHECSNGCGTFPCAVGGVAVDLSALLSAHKIIHAQMELVNIAIMATVRELEEAVEEASRG